MGEPIPPELPWCDYPTPGFEEYNAFEAGDCGDDETGCEGVSCWVYWASRDSLYRWFNYALHCDPPWALYVATSIECLACLGGFVYCYAWFTYIGQVGSDNSTPWPIWLCHDPGYLLPVDTAKSEEGNCADGYRWTRIADWQTSTNILIKTAQLP